VLGGDLLEFGVEKRKVILEYGRGQRLADISRLLYFMIPLKCVLLSACL
jgi:hypothetical protein